MTPVLLGISGGVDSVVAASLLQRDAHSVVGVTLFLCDEQRFLDGIEAAKDACGKLGIEHRVVDVRDEFEKQVAARVIAEVHAGLEPDAGVLCSRFILEQLFKLARQERIPKVATGHYAQVVSASDGIGTYPLRLLQAKDRHSDQSFQLYGLNQSELNTLMLPLAQQMELDVRMHAMRSGLLFPEYDPDDTPLLYGKHTTRAAWIERRGKALPVGEVLALNGGARLGEHNGLHSVDLGQKITLEDGSEQYVAAKDYAANALLVGPQDLARGESCLLKDVHWTSIHPIEERRSCRVKLDVRGLARPAQLVPQADGKLVMSFTIPVEGLASGKSVVFYSDDMVLGGGIIA